MIAPARMAALHALVAIAGRRADLPTALAQERDRLPDDRDRSLAAAIVHGTLRWQRACDALVQHAAGRPVESLDLEVVVILRMSLFQLLHLDRVPASAVVDDAVSLARSAGRKQATGFVNAVLRTLLRQRRRLPLPPRPVDPADRAAASLYLGVTLSHPDWLVNRWLDRVGFDAAEAWVKFNNEPAPLTLSVNRLKTSRAALRDALAGEGIETEPVRHAPHGLRVLTGNPLRAAGSGLFFVQDEASQLVALVADARPGDRTLDVCAAPGGKTVVMNADMQDRGVLVACDVRARRVALLRETIRRSGGVHVHPVRIGTSGALPFAPVFDRVLVDAPCSGLGTVRRDPDIKWRRQEADLPGLAERQRLLLARAAAVVRPGGRLVYATCSSEPEENDEVTDGFLAGHAGFRLLDLREHVPDAARTCIDDRGMLRTLPFAHGLEAFFAAVLVRQG
jgi:16S rRNA (cytosine967-C5)-methyltransferase